jgi:hypothetical protein
LDFRKVLPLLPEPEFPQPVFRAVAAPLVQWIVVAVVAVVPAPALEPVSLHFHQPWQVLPVDYPNQEIKRHRNIIQEWLTVCSLFDTAIQLLFWSVFFGAYKTSRTMEARYVRRQIIPAGRKLIVTTGTFAPAAVPSGTEGQPHPERAKRPQLARRPHRKERRPCAVGVVADTTDLSAWPLKKPGQDHPAACDGGK